MNRTYYKSKSVSWKNIIGYVIIIVLSIIFLVLFIWLLPNNDKLNYKNYKGYESKIDKQLKDILASTDNFSKLYYGNKLSRNQMMSKLKDSAQKLNKLYDDFKWKKGDSVTKELFTLKKQVIINYANIYEYKAKAINKELPSTESQELIFIQALQEHYNEKDRYQKERFKLPF